ncbi:MAG: hypothetical protein ACU836_09715 [Gammaproteobacteria bacterium]
MVNQQIQVFQVTLTVHIDASLTPSPHKPKTQPSYEIVAMLGVIHKAAIQP